MFWFGPCAMGKWYILIFDIFQTVDSNFCPWPSMTNVIIWISINSLENTNTIYPSKKVDEGGFFLTVFGIGISCFFKYRPYVPFYSSSCLSLLVLQLVFYLAVTPVALNKVLPAMVCLSVITRQTVVTECFIWVITT